jgi:two-component system, sensor histidine kinase and response regulator
MGDRKHRLLIVDDDKTVLSSLARHLRRTYSVTTAATGEAALEAIETERPDLVLLDIMMPGLDGYEICRRVRADERHSLTKIILVSGRNHLAERLEGYDVGADDYIAKPFSIDELEAKVRIFLRLKRAEEVDKIKSNLLTLFSHETKTPMAAILGLAEILASDSGLSEEQHTCAEHILQSGRDLNEFIRKAALLVELQTGLSLEARSEPVEARIDRALRRLQKSAEDKRITTRVEVEPDLELTADWTYLQDALDALLHNAIKFSPDAGEVEVRAASADGACRITVRDHGEGIPPARLDEIFDVFAIEDVEHHHSGQGLSLAIARRVTELHGGTLLAESAPGQGAEFVILVPHRRPEDDGFAPS